MENEKLTNYSIIIPAFNEEKSIIDVINKLSDFLEQNFFGQYEIIVINDGSSDKTLNILKEVKVKNFSFYSNPYNKGYGASLKLGARKAIGKYVVTYDADQQHSPENLSKLIEHTENYDMVVGSRVGYKGPFMRQPGKKILTMIANYLVEYKIPDLNSGLRIVERKLFFRYINLYPNNFSLSTTITMTFLKDGLNVKFVPIEISKRVGKSMVKPSDAIKTFLLIVRMITLFSPLRFFLPFTLLFVVLFLASMTNDIVTKNVSDSTVVLFMSTILMFFFGIILDQLASIRREMNKYK